VTFEPQPATNTASSAPPMRLRKFALNSKYPAASQAHDYPIQSHYAVQSSVDCRQFQTKTTVVRCGGMCNKGGSLFDTPVRRYKEIARISHKAGVPRHGQT
jgi:hypothetical protein